MPLSANQKASPSIRRAMCISAIPPTRVCAKVDTHGIITTIAGPGVLGTDYWNAVAFDPLGNLYVAITHTGILDGLFYSVIDRVNPDGTLTPVAGNSRTCGNPVTTAFTFDGVPAMQAPLCVDRKS